MNFDVFGFLSIGCVVDVDFFGELVTTCVAPIVAAVISAGYAWRRAKINDEKRTASQIFTQFYLILLFCAYSGITRKVRSFRFFYLIKIHGE